MGLRTGSSAESLAEKVFSPFAKALVDREIQKINDELEALSQQKKDLEAKLQKETELLTILDLLRHNPDSYHHSLRFVLAESEVINSTEGKIIGISKDVMVEVGEVEIFLVEEGREGQKKTPVASFDMFKFRKCSKCGVDHILIHEHVQLEDDGDIWMHRFLLLCESTFSIIILGSYTH